MSDEHRDGTPTPEPADPWDVTDPGIFALDPTAWRPTLPGETTQELPRVNRRRDIPAGRRAGTGALGESLPVRPAPPPVRTDPSPQPAPREPQPAPREPQPAPREPQPVLVSTPPVAVEPRVVDADPRHVPKWEPEFGPSRRLRSAVLLALFVIVIALAVAAVFDVAIALLGAAANHAISKSAGG